MIDPNTVRLAEHARQQRTPIETELSIQGENAQAIVDTISALQRGESLTIRVNAAGKWVVEKRRKGVTDVLAYGIGFTLRKAWNIFADVENCRLNWDETRTRKSLLELIK